MSNINKAAQSASQALEFCQSIAFQKMVNIERQFKWCSYYIYGVDLNKLGSNPADPRLLFKESEANQCGDIPTGICTTYADFASTYHPELFFLYLKPSENDKYILNATDIKKCSEIIHNYYAVNNGGSNIEEKEVDCLIAALQYFGKYDYFMDYLSKTNMGDMMQTLKSKYDVNNSRYTSMSKTKPILIDALGGITPTYFEILGGMYYKQLPYIPAELKQKYDEAKGEYQKNLNQIMNLLAGIESLQLCWAEATNSEINMTDFDNSAATVSATAVANCVSDAVVDGFLNGAELDETQVKTLQIAIENVEKRNKERDAELKEELMKKQSSSSKINIIIISIIGVVLFIFMILMYVLLNKKITEANNLTMMSTMVK